nr:MAG TPA: hypothetical protein [Caudoviricetes sp.]
MLIYFTILYNYVILYMYQIGGTRIIFQKEKLKWRC